MTYPAEVLADSSYLYWRLGEPSGTTAADSSGNARPGTYTNTPTLGIAGAIYADTAVSFDGPTDQYVVSTTLLNTTTVTVEAWVYLTAAPVSTQECFVGFFDGYDSGVTDKVIFVDTDGKAYFYVYDGAPKTTSAPTDTLPLNAWNHVVGTADGTTSRCYVNGAEVGSIAAGATYAGYTVNNIFVCGESDSTAFFDLRSLTIRVDEAAVYTSVLSAARVAAHFAAGTPSVQPPPAHIPFMRR